MKRELKTSLSTQKSVDEEKTVKRPTTLDKVEFYNDVIGSEDLIDIKNVTKVLNIEGFGNTELFEFLKSKSIFMGNNKPYQKYVDCGYFRVVEIKWYDYKQAATEIIIKVMVFQRGLDFISKLLKQHYKR